MDFHEIKELQNTGKTCKQIMSFTGWGNSTVNLAFNSNTYEEYKQSITDRLKKYQDKIRTFKLQEPQPVVMAISNGQDHSLDGELLKLEEIFESLKSQIAVVVAKSIEQGIVDYKKDTEAELVSLRTVVEAGKANNLVDMIKKNMRLA